jgi:hypothetical protein
MVGGGGSGGILNGVKVVVDSSWISIGGGDVEDATTA